MRQVSDPKVNLQIPKRAPENFENHTFYTLYTIALLR